MKRIGSGTVPRRSNGCGLDNAGVFVSDNRRSLASGVIRVILTHLPSTPRNAHNVSLFVMPGFLPGDSNRTNRHGNIAYNSVRRGVNVGSSTAYMLGFSNTMNCLVNRPGGNLGTVFAFVGATHVNANVRNLTRARLSFRGTLPCTGSHHSVHALSKAGSPRGITSTVVRRTSIHHVLLARGTFTRNNHSVVCRSTHCTSGVSRNITGNSSTRFRG